MNELCMIIKDTVKPNFLNIRTSLQTYDRDALCCGAPCWRWAYHALHSADKWFINPNRYEEPSFHEEGMDNPDNPTSVVLSDGQLTAYLDAVEEKTMAYLDTLTDDMLYEKPEGCRYTRMELVLRQFRHLGVRNGQVCGRRDLLWALPVRAGETLTLPPRYRKSRVRTPRALPGFSPASSFAFIFRCRDVLSGRPSGLTEACRLSGT